VFESFVAVPLHFTIEFLGFLVAAGGAVLVLSRPNLIPEPTSNRVSVALGLGTLAIAQVVHGGAFIENEGSPVLIALKTLAFALILVGLVGGVRPTASAAAGYHLKEPLELAPAAAAFLVAAAAIASSFREGPRELRRLGIGTALLGVSELMTAAAPKTIIGGSFEPFAYSAHGLKLLGFFALASWLWSAVRYSVRTRFVASFGALLVAVILALSTALIGVISNNVQREELGRVSAQVANAASVIEKGDTQDLSQDVNTLALLVDPQRIEQPGQAPAVAADLFNLQLVRPDFIIVDPANGLPGPIGDGPVESDKDGASKGHPEPLTNRDVLAIVGSPVVREARRTGASASPTQIGDFVGILASRQVTDPVTKRVVAVVTIGRWLDATTIAGISLSVDPAQASLLVGDRVVASRLQASRARALKVPGNLKTELSTSQDAVSREQNLGGSSYFTAYATLRSPGNNVPVATLVLSTPASSLIASREEVTKILFLAAMIVGAVALALAWLSGRRITRPIQALTATATAVREGDLTAKATVTSTDEVGQLGETFNEMTASLYQMTNDLLEAARGEHELRTRIETIIQSMADGLVAVDADKNVLAFNAEAELLTGIEASEAMGEPVEKVLVAKDAEGTRVMLPIYDLGNGSMAGVMLQHRSGESIPIAFTSAVLRDEDDSISGAVAVMRDMTREREVERMKTEFLSNISHELRTPLTPIKGYAEMLQRKELPEHRIKQMVGGILESTARLERIVELLVDFSAMEAGRMAPRTGKVDMTRIIGEVVAGWRERSSLHDVVSDVEDGLPPVIGDERLLKRSLEEVVDNAVKFSPHGGKISLEARHSSNGTAGPRQVEVVVTDVGIGISSSDLSKIFSDFQQLDGSETRTFGGLGLGLAFVRRIVEVHEGSIEVESEVDEGTKLTITLPAARAVSPDAED
jgi:PAS domain S-box-containing protein